MIKQSNASDIRPSIPVNYRSSYRSLNLRCIFTTLVKAAGEHRPVIKPVTLCIMLIFAVQDKARCSQFLARKQKEETFKATRIADRIVFKKKQEQLFISFVKEDVVHIQYVSQGKLSGNNTGILTKTNSLTPRTSLSEKENFFEVSSNKLTIKVNKLTGAISYLKPNGELLCHEDYDSPRQTEKIGIERVTYNDDTKNIVKTANGDVVKADISKKELISSAWKATLNFRWKNGEALYGLGSHQEGFMNLRSKKQFLYQHNLKKSVPVIMSSLGYGILFDVGSTMIFEDKPSGGKIEMAAVNQIDYYFMYGPELDKVVSHYRTLTGKVQIMPKYMFGYVQSKERYTSDKELDSIVTRFSNNNIPLDVIVQDWNYWKNGLWGHKKFDEKFYPNPKDMIGKIHQKNVHFMLSIWPNVADDEEREMSAKGFVIGRSIYDAFNPEARKMYWQNYVQKNLFSKGVDAWWCDSSEPVDGDWDNESNSIANDASARYKVNSLALNNLLGPLRANLYSLNHAKGIYENQRSVTSEKRVVNLTRSGFAGIQRYGTIIWNGDTKATWADFANWIPSGLNYMATGNPYWTIDAGAFFVKSRSQWFWKGDYDQGTSDLGYREFYLRTLQFATWLPMMRSHGTDFAREPWSFGKDGEPIYGGVIAQIHLRYRLLPYTYSLAAMVSRQDYTMTRPLIFDFRTDSNVYDIKDQFMFGPSFLVCAITTPMYYGKNSIPIGDVEKKKSVYLPKGNKWINFWTGQAYQGGQTIKVGVDLKNIPVFVKEGSIIPLSPIRQFSQQKDAKPLQIRIYPGKDADFNLYEDEGDNYNYEKGKFSIIGFHWNDQKKQLTVSKRQGEFTSMEKQRSFDIAVSKSGFDQNENQPKPAGRLISYNGNAMSISF